MVLTSPPAQGRPAERVSSGQAPADVAFSEPASGSSDAAILGHLDSLIRNAASESEIFMNIYEIQDNGRIEKALNEVRCTKNVKVFVTYDDKVPTDNWYADLTHYPDSPTDKACEPIVRTCAQGCMSSETNAKAHMKYAFFSNTSSPLGGASGRASWISSSNLMAPASGKPGSGSGAFNDAITVWDDDLATHFRALFADEWFATPSLFIDYFRPERGIDAPSSGWFYSPSAQTVVKVSPDPFGVHDGSTEMWVGEFGYMYPPADGPDYTLCALNIAMAQMDGNQTYIVDQLARLANGRCAVHLLVGENDGGGPDIHADLVTRLCKPRAVPIQLRVKGRIHNKMATYLGRYNSAGLRGLVWTGSHNWTTNAENVNDELLVRLYDSGQVYNAYNAYFSRQWTSAMRWCN
jgi:hypothetical protein